MTRLFLSLVAAVLVASTALAGDIRTERVHFQHGKSGATMKGHIQGRQSVSYILGAKAGQTMKVRLDSPNTALYFNVYAPGKGPGDDALAVSENTGPMVPDLNRFEGMLPESGDYTVSVYLYRNAARSGERADYQVEFSIR